VVKISLKKVIKEVMRTRKKSLKISRGNQNP
jgi:hypothetical protein